MLMVTEMEMSSFWLNFVIGCTGSCQNDNVQTQTQTQTSLFNINRYIDTSIISGLHAIDRNTNNIIPLINYEI